MKLLERIFHLTDKKTTVKNEIIGGLVTFAAMCYILPVNSSIMAATGMNSAGVFTITALLSFGISLIMAFVANYPIVLSSGMGLNAYLAYTLGGTWQQKMILLTVAGLLFFIFSITPIRKKIIEAIPKDVRGIIAAALGVFIIFVGFQNTGLVVAGDITKGSLVQLGNFADPGTLIGTVAILLTVAMMFFAKSKLIKNMAIPFGLLFAAVVGLTTSLIMKANGSIIFNDGTWIYNFGQFRDANVVANLPIAPWYTENTAKFADFSGLREVMFYGTISESYVPGSFANDLRVVFSTPSTYVGIFSLLFVNLSNTTATLIAVGESTGAIDENGKMQDYRKVVLADGTGALVAGPCGTSVVMPFAESNVGVAMGARTGFSTLIAASMFLLSAFIYPIFSIFTAGSVTAPCLVALGLIITVGGLKNLDWKDPIIAFTAIISMCIALLTYSIANGIGFGLIAYSLIMIFAGKAKQVPPMIYGISILFIISFTLETIMPLLTI